MADSALVTLTTDFGEGSAYVAAMKGAILSVSPAVRILDLSSSNTAPGSCGHCVFPGRNVPDFSGPTIHVVVVDPGVGTSRHLLCVNGMTSTFSSPITAAGLDRNRWPSPPCGPIGSPTTSIGGTPVSATFHGRDILAPAAGHLANGLSPAISVRRPKAGFGYRCRNPCTPPVHSRRDCRGRFLRQSNFEREPHRPAIVSSVFESAGQTVAKSVRTYGDGEPGDVVALIGSGGRVEVAVVNGSAARNLGLGVGALPSRLPSRPDRDSEPCFPLGDR